MSVLQGLRIIELAEDVAGEYCGKLLADFGAEVIKIERPGAGSPTRSFAPLLKGKDGREESGLFVYLNTNKKSVTLDLSSPADMKIARELMAGAVGVIDDHGEDWLAAKGFTRDKFIADFPKAVFCGISNFGQGAPDDLRVTKSINVWHASGWGYHTPTPQDVDRPPLKGAGRFLPDLDAGLESALAMMAALIGRERTGNGEYVDVSKQDVLVWRADMIVGRMLNHEMYVGNNRGAYDFRGPSGPYRCADGYIDLYATPVHWKRLMRLVEHAPWTAEFPEDWLFKVTDELETKFRKHFGEWLSDKKRDDVCLAAQSHGLALVRMNDAEGLHESEQYKHRGFFQELEHPNLGKALYPTVPYKLSATPVQLKDAAPALGQHNQLLSSLPKAAAEPRRPSGLPLEHKIRRPSRGGPLDGIRVLALTKVWAGPYAAKLLAFLGAEVIKVESNKKIDEMRWYATKDINRAPIFLSLNHELMSAQLDMKTEKGVKYLRDLIAQSDIVLENLRAGSLDRAGLSYNDMRAIKKDIILVGLKMYGSEGPLAYQMGYAPSFAALGGINSLVGYDGEPPRGVNQSYGDATAGAAMAFGALAALMHRERTGEGQYVDLSATESVSSMIGDSLLAYSLTGKVPRHDANRHTEMAPHGVYPSRDGEWISIAVASDAEWIKLCETLGADDLKHDSRLATLAGRQAHQPEVDEKLGALTVKHFAASLAARLRQTGVAAFKSQTSLDVISDTHLWERGTFRTVTDASGNSRPIVGPPWRFARSAAKILRGSPNLGEHNAYTYRDLLGLSNEELEELVKEGVVN
jgi:crotonobetainyl-CoA:carnitine CoA-transferase CaiB-like acyl-CoA transferase